MVLLGSTTTKICLVLKTPIIIFYIRIVVWYYSYLTFDVTPSGIVIVVNSSIIEGYIV